MATRTGNRPTGLGPTRRELLLTGAALATARRTTAQDQGPVGPARGSLVLVGGGSPVDASILKSVIELAGGRDAPLVLIPTAGGAASYGETFGPLVALRDAGAANVRLLHTDDRAVADSDAFTAPLRTAAGVFISGGTNALLADAYLDTRTHRALSALLDRGGVVAGSSAGAEVQGSFMPRGQTGDANGDVLIGDHHTGFGFLRNVAVDAHVLVKNRHFDLLEITRLHPELLGLGLDEQTAIVVRAEAFEVIGRSYVLVYDRERTIPPDGGFYFLRPGDRYDLRTREGTRLVNGTRQPIERVRRRPASVPGPDPASRV